jgi:hypothetical protein
MMITVLFGGEGLVFVDTLDPNESFTENHFIGLGCLI